MAEDYVYEDDLNVIFKLIEEGDLQNYEFERQISTAISESGMIYSQLACTSCNKTYKTQSGLTGDIKSKHHGTSTSQEIRDKEPVSSTHITLSKIHNLELKKLIEKAALKLSTDECFSEDCRQGFANFKISIEECIEISELFDEVFAEFHGNAEKFDCKFYKVSIEFAVFKFSSKLPIDHSPMLLCTELATLCLDLLANGKQHLE